MAGFVLPGSILSILRKICIAAGSVLLLGWAQIPVALAQHIRTGVVGGAGQAGRGGHVGGPGLVAPRGTAPAAAAPAAISRTRVYAGPRGAGLGARGFRLRPQPTFRVRRPVFFAAPFVGVGLGFDSFGWPACGAAWNWGFGCGGAPLYGLGLENYGMVQPYENFAYLTSQTQPDLIWLLLKDGTARSVTDYWFVNGQVHFTTLGDGGAKPEQVIGEDELDLRRTVDVNTRRGFRIVRRDEPWQQYLRDHPDTTPPDVQ
jgi:hypothetical protein